MGCASSPDQSPEHTTPSKTDNAVTPIVPVTPVKPPKIPLKVVAVGDIMLGTDFPEDRLPPDMGQHLLAPVHNILADADITLGNYEGSFLTGGEPAKQCRNPAHCYLFRTPPSYVQHLVDAGFDMLSLANNHARDFGEAGRTNSMAVLAEAGLGHSGRAGDIASVEHNGLRIAFIAYAPFRGANNPLDLRLAQTTITELSKRYDLVFVSMHMGAEGEQATRIPFEVEMYHGENRGDVVRFARTVIDAGADLVIGHGPHVPRALELYQGRLIAYSLGNFCTYYGVNVKGVNGLAPILKVELADDGEFLAGRIISARQMRPLGPVLDVEHTAARLIGELTRQDFPTTPLEINASGLIVRK